MIYHITKRSDWVAAKTTGEYCADTLATEGFIHCSTAEQVVKVANTFFKGQRDLVLLCIDPEKIGAEIRWENCEGRSELFPHVYGGIEVSAVLEVVDFEPGPDGRFRRPETI